MSGIFLIDSKNSVIGHTDYTRLNKLPFIKRLYAMINRRYKRKYIDIRPFKINFN